MIEWMRVAELRGEVGPDAFEEVVDLFLEEVDGVIGRLGSAPDATTLADDLHFLKGSALNLGFQAVAALCKENEILLTSQGFAAVDTAALIACYEASKQAFTEKLGSAAFAA